MKVSSDVGRRRRKATREMTVVLLESWDQRMRCVTLDDPQTCSPPDCTVMLTYVNNRKGEVGKGAQPPI